MQNNIIYINKAKHIKAKHFKAKQSMSKQNMSKHVKTKTCQNTQKHVKTNLHSSEALTGQVPDECEVSVDDFLAPRPA